MPVGAELAPSAFWLLALDATAKDPASLGDAGIPKEYLGQARDEIALAVSNTEIARQYGAMFLSGMVLDLYYETGCFAHHGRQLASASRRSADVGGQ